MKSQTILVLFLAVVCGGSAAIGVSQLISQSQRKKSTNAAHVVVAAIDLPRGTVLTEAELRVAEWPQEMAPAGAITSIEKALERTAIFPLVKGEPVLESKLTESGAGRGLAARIPRGMRAFTIRTPHVASGVGGFLRPDDRVDILLTTTGTRDDGTGGGATTTLLQNIQVLAVDQHVEAPADNKVDPKQLKSVTLVVTPDQAAKLDLGMNKGTLHLSLRNPGDNEEANTRPATMADLRFHQEKPNDSLAALTGLVGVVADLWKSRGEQTSSDEAQQEPEYQPAQIRTLRGSHRGTVHVEKPR